MNRYVIAKEARQDLKEISRYNTKEQQSPQGAKRLRKLFLEEFKLLAVHPLIGELREDLGQNVRQRAVRNYVVYYEPTVDGVRVVQVVHGARNLPRVIRNRD